MPGRRRQASTRARRLSDRASDFKIMNGLTGSGGYMRGSGPESEADFEAVARAICLRSLTRGPRTRAQLAEALRRRNVPDQVAQDVLSRFTESGMIDDAAFAAAWVESRHAGRGLAHQALAHELRDRGVPDQYIEAALERLDPEQEAATARTLVQRRLRAMRGLSSEARLRRLTGMLLRRGYPPGLTLRIVGEALEAAEEIPGEREAAQTWEDFDCDE
jgi:regulatory protein